MYKVAALTLALVAVSGCAQQPNPGPDQPDKTEFILLGVDGCVRALDAVSSLHDYREPGIHETNLPDTFLRRPSVMWTYSMGEVGLQYLVARELYYRHHPKIARFITALDIAYDGETGVHNLTLWNGR